MATQHGGLWHPRTVVVKGFPVDNMETVISILISYFENPNKSSGGPLETTDRFPGLTPTASGKEVVVVFEEEKVATSVVEQGDHVVKIIGNDYNLTVKRCLSEFYNKYCKEHLETLRSDKTHHQSIRDERTDTNEASSSHVSQEPYIDISLTVNDYLKEQTETPLQSSVPPSQPGKSNKRAEQNSIVKPKTYMKSKSPAKTTDPHFEHLPCKVVVSPINENTTADYLEMYFESKKRSGGGAISSIQLLENNTAIVEFEYESDAVEVLSKQPHIINKHECLVKPFVAKKVKPVETTNRTIIVMGLKPPLTLDVLDLWLESEKNGGGALSRIDKDQGTKLVTVEFESEDHVANMLEMKSATITGVMVTFSKPVDLQDEDEDDQSSLVVTWTKQNSNIEEEILTLFFESKKKSGGGELESIKIDESKGRAIVRYKDEKVANNVLEKKELTLAGTLLRVQKLKKMKWDRHSVEVHGFKEKPDVEMLSLLFESRRKSGGGPIEELIVTKSSVIIRFENKLDAQRVLEKGSVEFGGKNLTMKKPNLDQDVSQTMETVLPEHELPKEIMVLGVNQETTTDMLEIFFENEQKSGGGPVKQIKLDEEYGTAIVAFESHKVAARVARKQQLTFMGSNLLVELKVPIQTSMRSQTLDEKRKAKMEGKLKLEVTGILENTPQEYLLLFFESTKNCGGGPIKEMDFDPDSGTALISFKDEATLKNVMKRYHEQGLSLQSSRLCLKLVDVSQCAMSFKGSCAIEVRGTPANCTEDMISFFFENRRRSGGGDIDEFVFLEDSIVITFENNEVAERVFNQHRQSPLKMESKFLDVKHLKNSHRPKMLHDETIVQQNALFLEDLPETAEYEDIVRFLERVPKCQVREVWFGVSTGRAIAHFHIMPDYQKIYQHCCLKPLMGNLIGIQCVEKPKSIEVYNIAKLSKQKLEMYFEHRRSGGGEIQEISLNTDDDFAIITFTKFGVAENVVNKMDHSMEKIKLVVGLHYECIGILPPGHDRTTPKGSIPDDLVIKSVDTDILRYLAKTPANKSLVNDRLKTANAELIWPDASVITQDGAVIRCLLTTANASKTTKEFWPETTKKTLEEAMGLFMKDSVNVLQEGWPEFIKQAGKMERMDDSLMVHIDNDSCTVIAIGKMTPVNRFISDTMQKKYDVEDAIARKKQAISEDVKNLPSFKVKFVQAIKFPQQMKQIYPSAQLSCKDRKITIKGLPDEVLNIKLQMYELMNEIKSDTVNMSAAITELLKLKKTKDFVIKQFQDRSIFMLFEVEKPGKVSVHARTPEDLTSGTAVLKSSVVEIQRDIKPENTQTIVAPGWHRFLDGLKTDYNGEMAIDVTDSQIRLVCIRDISEGVIEMIVNYLDENTTLEQFIGMDEGTLKYLTTFKNKELSDVAKRFTATVEANPDENRCGISVRGTSQVLKLTIPQIVDLAKDIVECTHGINKAGMPKYFLSTKGQDYLESLEHKNKVVILTGEKSNGGNLADYLSSTAPVALKPTKVKSKIDLDSGHIIYVVDGDLTDYKVDAIVNAANESLEHVGGIAKAIVDKGGPSIQAECRKFIAQRGRLSTGAVFASEAGKLPCKKIIHTVGPKWQTGYRGEDNQLYEAVFKTLDAVRKIGLRTVGLPAISSGVFGFPLAVACKTIIEAVSDFAEKDNALTEIHLVDPSDKVVNQFHVELCSKFGRDSVTLIDGKQERTRVSSAKPTVSTAMNAPAASARSTVPNWKAGAAPQSLITQQGVTVTSIEGEIAKQQANIIVNTTSKDLNLSGGGVSSSILKAAGPTIQQECQQNYPGGVAQGQIAQTSGGNMNCQAIYHGSLPHWKDSKGDTALRQFMDICMKTAQAAGVSSIAIPAIGTGNLGYPRDKVAFAMYDEVRKFSKNNPMTSLKDIRFLVYDKPTVQSFYAEISKLQQNLAQPIGQPRPGRKLRQSSSFDHLGATGGRGGASRYSSSPGPSHGRRPHTESGASSTVLVIRDNVTIQVAQGDITEEACDAIVNGTDSDLNFNSQVSRAILRKGGDTIQLECVQKGRANKQGIAITTGGRLNAKNIIHVAVPRELDGGWMSFSSKWSKRMEAILNAAVELKCCSLAIPALGTGTLSLSESEIAETMIKAVADFCHKKKGITLQHVRFVIYQDRMVSTFQSQLEACAKKTKGFLKQVQDYFRGPIEDRPSMAMKSFDGVHASRLNFHIYASDQKAVNEVTTKIEGICNTESKMHTLDSRKDMEAIKELTEEQIALIKSFETQHCVKIEILRYGKINKITIEGQTEDTFAVATEINKFFREIDDNKTFEEMSEILHKQVQWAVDEGTGFDDYPPAMSAIIEKAFQEKKPYAEFTEEDTKHQLKTCRVVFKDMVEILDGDASNSKPVKRKTPENIELPAHWATMKKDEQFKVVQLSKSDNEYKDVEQKFANSMSHGGSPYNGIQGISRIQNPNLYQRYCVHRSHMETSNPPGTQNERELWHGTSATSLDEIHATGFNRGFCGVNGTAYGKGVYFATFASLSNGYSKPDANGQRHMYLSRVLTGEFTRGNSAFIVPPQKNPTVKTVKFDSVVDNEGNPKIYVIFCDTQAYPEYLVQYC